MAMADSVAVVLLVVLGFFAFNFAVLTFYLYFKLKKARQKSKIKPMRREQFDTEVSFGESNNTHSSSGNHLSKNSSGDSNKGAIISGSLINNLELAMSEGNQAYLERTINETRNQVNKNNHLNSVMKQLDQAEVLLENLQLRQNMETALKLKDIWSIELAVRNIMNCSNRNVDLIELAEKGKIYLRNNISHDTAIYNLLNSQNLKAALSIAEILGIENTSINARKLVDSIRMKIEIKGCTEELLVAIQKREMTVLEAAISRANKIITHSDDMRLNKEYSRAKMLLDWLSQMNQARLRLKTAIISRDQHLLEIAIEKFKDYNLSDETGDLKIAKKLLKVFHCRTSLALAMESRDLNVIEKCLEEAENLGAHHAPEVKRIIKQTLLLQKQLSIAEEIVSTTDDVWGKLVTADWSHQQFLVMKVVSMLIGIAECDNANAQNRDAVLSANAGLVLNTSSLNSGLARADNLKLADLGKDRFKRRVQTLDSQSIDWITCERIKPVMQKLYKHYGHSSASKRPPSGSSAGHNSQKSKTVFSIMKGGFTLTNTAGKTRLDSYFSDLHEWCESVVAFVEDRLKKRNGK